MPDGEPNVDARCPECRYLLRGLTSDQCPECGQKISAEFMQSVTRRRGGWILWVIRIVTLVAMALTGYLLSLSISGQLPGSCSCGNSGWGCSIVLTSPWSQWMGVPVTAPALAVYVVALLATILSDHRARLSWNQMGWQLLVIASVLAIGAAVWFMLLQIVALNAVCGYCLVAHCCAVLLAAAVLTRALLSSRSDNRDQIVLARIGRQRMLLLAGISLLLVAALIATQAVLSA